MIIRSSTLSKPTRRTTRVTQEISCAGCAIVRDLLNYNGELKDEWISCNGCKQWFHFDCAGFKKAHEVRDVDKYFCPPCEPAHGKTTYVRKSTRAHVSVDYAELQKGVLKTSEESMEHHYIQPIKDGTFQFDPEFFPRMPPELVTKDFFERGGFVEPICIPASLNPRPWLKKNSETKDEDGDVEMTSSATDDNDSDGLALDDFEYDALPDVGQDKLGMVMPQDLTVRQVCSLVGPETPLDVIDVKTQNSGGKKWNLKRWADYYEETGDKHIRNVISLEVSQTKLGRLLRRPQVVREIDLQDQIWPAKEVEQGKYPKVQFYCLMSVADSYTDFHIDFGGSSVYYHILKGKKTFFFIPPTPKHLKAYQDWNDSHEQNYTFLPDITKECYRVDLGPGDTMLIPSGWIHAVWTPATSLVIGGNFLTRMSYRNQFRVYDIEKANGTPMKFRYPYFVRIMWYTVIQYLEKDPLPEEVSQSFLAGKQFERETPIWADYDGDLAAADSRSGAQNERYYSQAEVEGLPDLAQFVFRTVMVVMGRVEGISAEQMKRVNSSIPKGHGDPLDLARAFGLWVAWKRGNEDPPAWAHPDAVLPNRSEEGPPKKLSQRALKEMERKEAIAAWRIAPDRQSARPPPPHHRNETTPSSRMNSSSTTTTTTTATMMSTQSMPFAMTAMHGQHLSTPKTSVLGPKRVACDACRKRRIRCKHKDFVMQIDDINNVSPVWQASPSSSMGQIHQANPSNHHLHQHNGNNNNSITKGNDSEAKFSNHVRNGNYLNNFFDGFAPGTNAYVNANIPMAMNGIHIFGDAPKRGRSKACLECRKSKRRCIHDENGQVDPVKAAETPIPRGSASSKKRPFGSEGSPP
ncbi:Clavaminate synthase-like protein, partial [Dissoconium aciculare CBS 342.82]|uniref:JmjC domain-containing histone demethylation protein 1 n=1 Tax=Dissoconium aciculare CBS 342.82 TaxID=1314786 RepID=A0A6J3LYJ4_9PEZI